tara:strand:- start:2218 stop:2412 length:195 start_codon:yes stop_codon:yes gene_type:complete
LVCDDRTCEGLNSSGDEEWFCDHRICKCAKRVTTGEGRGSPSNSGGPTTGEEDGDGGSSAESYE